jgi:hypothetical protein
MDIDHLVKIITREVFNKINSQEKSHKANCLPKKNILAIYTGGSIGFEQSLRELAEMTDWANITIFLSHAASSIYPENEVFSRINPVEIIRNGIATSSFYGRLNDFDAVLIPVLTINTTAKLANGICDTGTTSLIIAALTRGIKVIAAKNAADVQDEERKRKARAPASTGIIKMAGDNLNRLESLGIVLVNISHLSKTLSYSSNKPQTSYSMQHKKNIVASMDITPDVIDKGYLKVDDNSIITPLALDMIKQHGIEVIYE